MDGVHDVGGIAGFGTVEREPDEPAFHTDWERDVFRLFVAAGVAGLLKGGMFRHSIERMDPGHYLTSTYYEHWLTGLATLMVDQGVVTRDDLERRAGGQFPLSRTDRGEAPNPRHAPADKPLFEVGSRVRVREWHPNGHTRAPRYVQGKRGIVVRLDGSFSLPDVEAHADYKRIEPTYSVRFTATELWGDGGGRGEMVHVDLWEGYLEEDR